MYVWGGGGGAPRELGRPPPAEGSMCEGAWAGGSAASGPGGGGMPSEGGGKRAPRCDTCLLACLLAWKRDRSSPTVAPSWDAPARAIYTKYRGLVVTVTVTVTVRTGRSGQRHGIYTEGLTPL